MTHWDFGVTEAGVTETLDLALWVEYRNLNPHAKHVRVTLEHSTWDEAYDLTYATFSGAGQALGAAGMSLYDPLPGVEFEPRAFGQGSGYWPMQASATSLAAGPAFLRLSVTPTEDAWRDLDAELVATLLVE